MAIYTCTVLLKGFVTATVEADSLEEAKAKLKEHEDVDYDINEFEQDEYKPDLDTVELLSK